MYKTTNRGTNWTKLTGTQFDRVTSITFNPADSKQAFLTTETQGLWMSSNMNTATPSWSLVSSYLFRQPERVYFNPYKPAEVWVSSFGNGMKVGNMSTGKPGGVPLFANAATFTIYPNPATDRISVKRDNAGVAEVAVSLLDATGRNIQTKPAQRGQAVVFDLSKCAPGMYWITDSHTGIKFIRQ